MTRTFLLAVVLGAALLVPRAGALQPGPATIKVTSRLSSTHTFGGTVVRAYDLLNRPSFHNPIGMAYLTCSALASGLLSCHEYLRLQRGQIVTEGVVSNIGFYRLAVTGGTGYYDNVGGTLTVQQIGTGAQALVVDLNAS